MYGTTHDDKLLLLIKIGWGSILYFYFNRLYVCKNYTSDLSKFLGIPRILCELGPRFSPRMSIPRKGFSEFGIRILPFSI